MVKKKLSKKEILHLAKLANLTLSEKEVTKLSKQLTTTLDYIKNLSELKTGHTPPTHHTVNSTNIFFEDGTTNKRRLSKISKHYIIKRIL
jgi:aspartyl-tRNA(Asn)/glutamyl-tRNA(Gln) amidotransferase subunit C